MSAIDAAVIHLIVKGMSVNVVAGRSNALQNPIIARYSEEAPRHIVKATR